MATTAALEDAVGYRLGFTISATSVPTSTEVQAWLTEAALKIAKRANPLLIEGLIDVFAESHQQITLSELTNYLRPVGLHLCYSADSLGVRQARFLDVASFGKAVRGSSAFIKGTLEFPVYTIRAGSVQWYPYQSTPEADTGVTLDESIDIHETEWTVSATAGFSENDILKVDNEVVTVDSIDNSTTMTVSRGQYGTLPDTHENTTNVYSITSSNNNIAVFEYIQEPADASDLPDIFNEVMIDYATMMAKLQDEELADAQVFGQLFDKEFGGTA